VIVAVLQSRCCTRCCAHARGGSAFWADPPLSCGFTVGLTSMTSRERSGRPGAGKTDPVDAVAITRITAREPNLPAVRLAVGQAADLRALADYRAQLVAERTALANRTHTELHGLLPGYQAEIPRLTAPTFIAAATDRLAGETSVRAQLIRRRLIRLAELTAEIREVAAIINAAVAEVTTGLTGLYGLGPVGAATILGEVADVRRYRSRHAFAAANGRPAPGLLRAQHEASAQPLGRPQPESGAPHDGDHPDPRRHPKVAPITCAKCCAAWNDDSPTWSTGRCRKTSPPAEHPPQHEDGECGSGRRDAPSRPKPAARQVLSPRPALHCGQSTAPPAGRDATPDRR
jgi:transposase